MRINSGNRVHYPSHGYALTMCPRPHYTEDTSFEYLTFMSVSAAVRDADNIATISAAVTSSEKCNRRQPIILAFRTESQYHARFWSRLDQCHLPDLHRIVSSTSFTRPVWAGNFVAGNKSVNLLAHLLARQPGNSDAIRLRVLYVQPRKNRVVGTIIGTERRANETYNWKISKPWRQLGISE